MQNTIETILANCRDDTNRGVPVFALIVCIETQFQPQVADHDTGYNKNASRVMMCAE